MSQNQAMKKEGKSEEKGRTREDKRVQQVSKKAYKKGADKMEGKRRNT